MNGADLTDILEDAGLSPYQAEAYVTLLELGAAPATEIADASGVPDPRIYDVLRDLEAKGYIETYHRDSLFARVHDPESVLQSLKTRSRLLTDAADEIEERWNQPQLDEHEVNFAQRPETVLDRTKTLARRADDQIQVCASVGQFETVRPALAEARDRGVEIRVSIATDDRTAIPPSDSFAEVCMEARHRELPSPYLALIDRTWTCFAPHEQSVNTYGILVNDRSHAYVFNWYFITCLWELWEPIYSARTDEPLRRYLDIREFGRDVYPLYEEGARIRVTLEGTELKTDTEIETSGEVVDIEYTGDSDAEAEVRLAQLGGLVNVTVATDDGEELVIGGWGSVVEDVESRLITVQDIEHPDEVPQ
jgi:sugar-specific transcriptional regulator TrmB